MRIASPGFASFAIIDPSREVGEEGQYEKFFVSETDDFRAVIGSARAKGFEIRYHYTDIQNDEGGHVPVRFIITEIPPGHIQPFHTHKNCYEMTVVDQGEVSYVEDDFLETKDTQEIRANAKLLKEGDVVFDNAGRRHTVANFSTAYARVLTTQTPKPYGQEFVPDWDGGKK